MTTIPVVLQGKRLVAVDVEGNGLQPPEIIELAAMTLDEADAIPQTWLVRPRNPISSFVTRNVHGISNAEVADCPPWSRVAAEIAGVLADRTLVAHNASVEYRVLTAHLPDWQPPLVLDTLRLAKVVWPGLPRYSLDQLVRHTKIDTTPMSHSRHHRAAYDAWCTGQLLLRLVTAGGYDWANLVQAAALPAFTAANDEAGGLW